MNTTNPHKSLVPRGNRDIQAHINAGLMAASIGPVREKPTFPSMPFFRRMAASGRSQYQPVVNLNKIAI